jgi:TRAP-type C4-dicarboxylate transport system permease large subunit
MALVDFIKTVAKQLKMTEEQALQQRILPWMEGSGWRAAAAAAAGRQASCCGLLFPPALPLALPSAAAGKQASCCGLLFPHGLRLALL